MKFGRFRPPYYVGYVTSQAKKSRDKDNHIGQTKTKAHPLTY